jgi:HEAT repeat protein
MKAISQPDFVHRFFETLTDWHVDVSFRSSLAAAAGTLADDPALQRIIDLIADDHIPSAVRTSLAVSLKHRDLQSSIDTLMDLIRDSSGDYSVRLAVADILSSVAGGSNKRGLEDLRAAPGIEDSIRLRVEIALGSIGDAQAVRPLITTLGDSSARPYLRLEAARILGAFESTEVAHEMLQIVDSRMVDPFGQELAVLVLDLRADPSFADALVDRLSDRSLPLSARLRMANTLASLEARDIIGRLVSLLSDGSFSAQLRGRIALSLTQLVDARDEDVLERVSEILRTEKDVAELYTLAWILSERVGTPVYPGDLGAKALQYPWLEDADEEDDRGLDEAVAEMDESQV